MHGVVESNPELFQTLKGAALTLLVLWTIAANSLVFIVLHKNPRLQTVPNLLVGNLAFSDLCLGLIVLPLSSVYAIAGEWLFTSTLCVIFVSDILCSTASIWNLSIVGLDRYWAITSPVAYMSKRNKRTAGLMILSVWISSALISLAPLLGWKQIAERGNMVQINGTWQCVFLDLPSYTIYSATGSFFIPTIVMFFVYFKIYQAFAKHRARQIYRQKLQTRPQYFSSPNLTGRANSKRGYCEDLYQQGEMAPRLHLISSVKSEDESDLKKTFVEGHLQR